MSGELLLCEQVLLLRNRNRKGLARLSTYVDAEVVSGGAVLDLILAGSLTEHDGEFVTHGPMPEHPALAKVFTAFAKDQSRSKKWRSKNKWRMFSPYEAPQIERAVAASLVGRGILGATLNVRGLRGMFYRERDPGPKARLRARLQAILIEGEQPCQREALLIALLDVGGLIRHLIPKEVPMEASRRAEEVAKAAAPVDSDLANAIRHVKRWFKGAGLSG